MCIRDRCKSDVIKAGDWAKITAQSKEAVDTMLGLKLHHVGVNTGNEEEAMKVANLIGSLLNMKVAPGNSSIFVGNKEFEIMKKPGRGTNGHIAIGCNLSLIHISGQRWKWAASGWMAAAWSPRTATASSTRWRTWAPLRSPT